MRRIGRIVGFWGVCAGLLVCALGPGCHYYPVTEGYTGKHSTSCGQGCGQGCGGTSTPKCSGTTLYSMDCAQHDYQLAGWGNASDDYLFFSNNASCGGACY